MLGKPKDSFKSALRSLENFPSLWWGIHGNCVQQVEEDVVLRRASEKVKGAILVAVY